MIAIIDYNAGNLASVRKAMDFLARPSLITNDSEQILEAERIIFPGVGAAGKAMADLRRTGLDQAILRCFREGKPILGICLGTQIIMERSEENDTACLGLVKGRVRRFPEGMKDRDGRDLKVPHMGWNSIRPCRDHPLLHGVNPESEFYFVHSYYPVPDDPENITAETDYGGGFASVIAQKNLFAVQFHLEKSGRPGLEILSNFCEWDGT